MELVCACTTMRITKMFCKHQALFWLQVLIITITEFVNMPLMLKGNVRGDRANLKRTKGMEILWFGVGVFCLGFFSEKCHTIALGFTSITRSVFWSPDCVSGCQRHHNRSDKNVWLGKNSQQWSQLKCCLSAAWAYSWWNYSGKHSEGIEVRGQCSVASMYLVFGD